MKKLVLASGLMGFFAVAHAAAGYDDDNVQLTFNGLVKNTACIVDVNGQSGSAFSIDFDQVTKNQIVASAVSGAWYGDTKDILLTFKNCAADAFTTINGTAQTVHNSVQVFFLPAGGVTNENGMLRNLVAASAGGAANMNVQVLDGTNIPIAIANSAPATPTAYPVINNQLLFKARLASRNTPGVTPGLVKAMANMVVRYF